VIAIAAKAKYAGLRGDMVLLRAKNLESGLEEGLAGFPSERR
jgi:hypothetical protein